MRIKNIELKNFKRFTDLTIANIPQTSKLVLIIGSNGSGKSSLFDAFDLLKKETYKFLVNDVKSYYRKNQELQSTVNIEFIDGKKIVRGDTVGIAEGADLVKKFIGRSSIRIVPHISNSADLNNVSTDKDSPDTYIENDTKFINDVFLFIRNINKALRDPVFKGEQADTLQIFKEFIDPLNMSLLKILGGDEKITIQIAEFEDATPNETAKLIFKKGESKINYDLLSHGEKQVIILLINFIVRKDYYEDSVIFIDEMDNHLNTSIQYSLLEEIVTRWIPESAQLWTASHALGFIDYARRSEQASTIDFNLLDFDLKQELTIQPKDKLDVYEIAIPKATIASILKGYKLVIAENNNAEHFNAVLGEEGFLFLPANNNREVFLTVKADNDKLGLRDRDYLRTDEIRQIAAKMPKLKILALYTFENYIYHPFNIAELKPSFDTADYIIDIIQQKRERLISIIAEIGTSRQHYIEFKDCIKDDGNLEPITDALQSNDFNIFYPFFNMKKHYSKRYLSTLNLSIGNLSQTQWFKNQISTILNT